MTMHRTVAVAGVLTLSALLLPTAISSPARSATSADARVALLDRPARPADSVPAAVAAQIDAKEIDLSSSRLAAVRGTRQYYVARGARGLCLIQVDEGPAYAATCASTLVAGGVYLATLDRQKGTMQLADVVPDDVTQASVAGAAVAAANNLVLADDVPIGAPVTVDAPTGSVAVPIGTGASVQPGG